MDAFDDFTDKHLRAWIEIHRRPEEFDQIYNAIRNLVKDDPYLLSDHSWPELERMAMV